MTQPAPIKLSTLTQPTEPETIRQTVDGLGELVGWKHDDGTRQFFGIPYATIPARFKASVPLTSWEGGSYDARKLGKFCPQPSRHYPFPMPERLYAGESLADEFACCNLNIVVPPGEHAEKSLPVLVYIHGGAFTWGSANYSIVDGRPLASLSSEIERPTIIVNLNFRVGFYGFLASADIKTDNGGELNGNWGLWDIRNALSWLNRHIASFNGDPANVTVFGQSAGGASADVLLQTKADHVLFQNVILMSGMLPVCGIYTEEEYEVIYNKLLRICDIDTNLPPAQRLAALRRIPSDYLSACTSPLQNGVSVAAFSPCDDGFLLGEGKRIPRLCEYPSLRYDFKGRIMMGDCRRKSRMPPLHSFAEMRNYITILIDEGIIFMPELVQEKLCTYELIAMIDKHLPEEIVSDTLSQYAITEHMTSEEHFLAAEALVSDIAFFAPAYYSANNHRSNNFFVYHWDHCSEWDNAWGRGKFAHHSMDYMFAFGCMRDVLSEEEAELGKAIGIDYIRFANGEDPYLPYAADHAARVYGPRARVQVEHASRARRPVAWLEKIRPHLQAFDVLAGDVAVRRPNIVNPAHKPDFPSQRLATTNPVASINGHSCHGGKQLRDEALRTSLETVM